MTTWIRWSLVVLLFAHGLIHLLGAAKGLGWASLPQLGISIGTMGGIAWLLAAALVLVTAGLVAVGTPTWWWLLAGLAAAVSQIVILTSWADAKAGSVVNIVLVLAAIYGFVSVGPPSLHAQWEKGVASADAPSGPAGVVTEQDLRVLPAPVAAYVRRSGAVGLPRVTSFQARFHGRIRSAPDKAWMEFTGQQVNTFGTNPRRLFIMDATMHGLPVTVLHVYDHWKATMRGKLLSLFTVVSASGPVMDRAETVTLFNDMVVFAPAAIVDAPIRWTAVDDQHALGTLTYGDETVTARLTFDGSGDLVDFLSGDRRRASADGKTFTQEPWSTPVGDYRVIGGRRVVTAGEGRWDAAAPVGPFTYLELKLDDISYNPGGGRAASDTERVGTAARGR